MSIYVLSVFTQSICDRQKSQQSLPFKVNVKFTEPCCGEITVKKNKNLPRIDNKNLKTDVHVHSHTDVPCASNIILNGVGNLRNEASDFIHPEMSGKVPQHTPEDFLNTTGMSMQMLIEGQSLQYV